MRCRSSARTSLPFRVSRNLAATWGMNASVTYRTCSKLILTTRMRSGYADMPPLLLNMVASE